MMRAELDEVIKKNLELLGFGMNSDKNSFSELVSAIRPLVRELSQIKKQAELPKKEEMKRLLKTRQLTETTIKHGRKSVLSSKKINIYFLTI